MRTVALLLVLLAPCLAKGSDKWKAVWALSCAQIKLDGRNVSSRPFAIYRASGPDEACCQDSQLVLRGKTKRFGYFQIRQKLELGYYFAVFEAKSMRVLVPVELKSNYVTDDCEEPDQIIRAKSNGEVEIDQIVRLD